MDIEVFRNRTYPMKYRHTDSDGNPVSLVGATVYFTVKTEQWNDDTTDASALIKKTITSHTNAAQGITDWTLTDVDMHVDPDNYYYDIIVEYAGQSQPPSLYGRFKVIGTPTNRNLGNE